MENREHYLKSFLLAGILMGLFSGAPGLNFGNCCCLWQILFGGFSGWLLCRSARNPVRMGEGMLVGVFSGMIGAMIFSVLTSLNYLWHPDMMNFSFKQTFQNENIMIPPEVQEMMEEALKWMVHPGLWLGFLLFFSFIIFAIMSGVGALISVSIFEPRFALARMKKEGSRGSGGSSDIVSGVGSKEADLYFPRREKNQKEE